LFPILMAWVLGIAFTQKGEQNKTVYVLPDKNKTNSIWAVENEKVYGEETGNTTRIKFVVADQEQATKAIKQGKIGLFMEEKGDSMIYHFDPHNADAQLTHLIIDRAINLKSNIAPSAVSALTSRGTRYIDFLIPGLIALGILNSCLWGIGWNLIEFRMKKLLRRMVATPMKKSSFLISLIITRIILSSVESSILFLFAFLYFGTIIEGSIFAFVLVYLAGIFAFSGVAILTASRTQNSQVGNGLINAVSLPMMILSGIFFSYQNFPSWAIPFIKSLPLTMVADSIRAIFIEGASLQQTMLPILFLSLIGAITFGIGLKLFKWY
jgi:ABC-2 type transport system permease protein